VRSCCFDLLLLLLLLFVQLMQAGVSAEEFEHTIADPELLMEVRSISRCAVPVPQQHLHSVGITAT
jgi:hypothetical protein